MARAWQTSAPAERLGTPRPGGVLTAAAIVPLGAALVLAAGLLPDLARIALGLALIVIGLAVRGLVGTATGARVGEPVARAVGSAVVLGGAVAVAGGLASAIGGDLPETSIDPAEYGDRGSRYVGQLAYRVVDALPAATLGVRLIVAAVLAGLGAGRVGALGRPRAGERAALAGLAGVGAAVALLAGAGDGALGLGTGWRGSALLAVAAVAAGVAVIGAPVAVTGSWSSTARRAAGVGAGVLLAVLFGEASGVVTALDGGVLGVVGDPPSSGVVLGAQLAVVTATAGALLALAVVRRDPLLGALPLAVLLQPHPVQGVTEAVVGQLLVPVLAALGLAPAALGRGPLATRVGRDTARPALAAVVVVLLIAIGSAFGQGGGFVLRGYGDVDGDGIARTIVTALVLVAGVVLVARAAPSRGREASGVALLLGLWALHPLWSLATAAPEAWYAKEGVQAAQLAVELALAGVVVATARGPMTFAAGALVLADVAGHLVGLTASDPFSGGDTDVAAIVVRDLGPSALLLLAAGVVAVAGPPRLTAAAQRAGAVFVLVAGVSAVNGAGLIVVLAGRSTTGDATSAPLGDGSVVLPTALLLLLLLGGSLLAASTARRPSRSAVAAATLATVSGALLAAAIGAGRTVRPADPGPTSDVALPEALLGFRATGSPLQDAGGGWPVLLGLLGAVLLVAAWWLESRRPAPPGAPVG